MKYRMVMIAVMIILIGMSFSLTLNDIRNVSKEDPEKAFELLVRYLKDHPKDKEAQALGKIIAAKRYLVKISPIADAVKKEDVYQLIKSMASLTSVSIKTMDYIEVVFPDFYDALREMTMKLDEDAFRTCSILPYRVREPKDFYKLVVDTYFASPLEFDPKRIEELKCMNLSRIKSGIKNYLKNFMDDESYYIKTLNLSDMLLIEPPHATDLRLYYDLSYKLATINVNGLTPEDFKELVDEYEKINLKKSRLSSKLKSIYMKLSEKYDLSFCKDKDICPEIVVLKEEKKTEEKLKEPDHPATKALAAVSLRNSSSEATALHATQTTAFSREAAKITHINRAKAEGSHQIGDRIKITIYISLSSLAGAMIVSLIIIRLRDPLKRIRKLKKRIAMNPTDPSLHFKLAELYEEIGRTEDAMKEYQLASKLFNEGNASSESDQKEF